MSNTEIPAAEVELDTKRQRLFHVTWLNRDRLDKQLRPLLADMETGTPDGGRMGILAKATFRGAVTLINHYLHFDVREHPSAILLILLKLIDDRSFDAVWSDYAPLVAWVNDDKSNSAEDTSSQVLPLSNGARSDIRSDTTAELPDVGVRDAGEWQDDVLQSPTRKNSRKKTDSDTGQQT